MEEDIRIEWKQRAGERWVRVEGELSVAGASELKNVLLEALETGEPAVADLSAVSAIDLAGLQLLCSAHRTFRGRESSFEVSERSQAVRTTAASAGFQMSSSVCPYRRDSDCLWR